MSLGEANVPIRATMAQLDKDLAKAKGKFDGFIGGLQTVGKLGIASVTALGTAAVAAAAGIVKLASDAEPLVGLQAGFATVTERIGSSSETMLAALQDASGGLITNRDLMTSFNKAAALVGDDFARVLPDAMGLVQKAALSTGQDMGYLFDSLVTGIGRLSPMILDNLGIQVSLAEVTERAAEMFGKSTAELSKQEQQAALTEIMMEKLNATYGDVPEMEQPFAKARTALANLKDEIGVALFTAIAPLAEKLVALGEDVLPVLMDIFEGRVLPVISGVATAFGLFFDHLSGGMPVVDSVATLITQLGVVFGMSSTDARALGSAFQEIVAGAQAVIAKVMELVAPIAAAIAEFVSWQDVAIALGVAIASVLIPIIASIVGAILPVIAVVAGAVALLRNAWENNWGGIQEKVAAVIAFIVPLVQNAIAAIRAWWAANGEAILAKAAQVWEAVKSAIQSAIETARAVVQAVLARIQQFWQQHGDSIMVIVNAFMTAIQGIIQAVTSAIASLWDSHGEGMAAGASATWETITATIDAAINMVGAIIDAVAALIQGDWEAFGAAVEAATDASWAAVEARFGTAATTVRDFIETAAAGIKAAWDTAMSAIQSAVSIATTAIDTLKSAAQSFWSWLSGKVFSFNISLPSLPDWATPGSPLPIHTAWKAFAGELNRMTIRPRFDLDTMTPALALAGAESGPTVVERTVFNLTAEYQHQDERSLAQDIWALEKLRT